MFGGNFLQGIARSGGSLILGVRFKEIKIVILDEYLLSIFGGLGCVFSTAPFFGTDVFLL
jgi:hypothetical protein